jgi:CRP-like cAMP-binding protein
LTRQASSCRRADCQTLSSLSASVELEQTEELVIALTREMKQREKRAQTHIFVQSDRHQAARKQPLAASMRSSPAYGTTLCLYGHAMDLD